MKINVKYEKIVNNYQNIIKMDEKSKKSIKNAEKFLWNFPQWTNLDGGG